MSAKNWVVSRHEGSGHGSICYGLCSTLKFYLEVY